MSKTKKQNKTKTKIIASTPMGGEGPISAEYRKADAEQAKRLQGRKMLQVPADLVAECWSIAQKRTRPTSWSQVAIEKLRDALKAAKPR